MLIFLQPPQFVNVEEILEGEDANFALLSFVNIYMHFYSLIQLGKWNLKLLVLRYIRWSEPKSVWNHKLRRLNVTSCGR